MNISSKFTIEDIMIKIIPGGIFIVIMYFLFQDKASLTIIGCPDILCTFIFLFFSVVVGEILQTIANKNEWIINLFFKCRRPSQVFLYKNNPVLKNEEIRLSLIKIISSDFFDANNFDKDYQTLSIWNKKNAKKYDNISQNIFQRLYLKVEENEKIKNSNRYYLFVRGTMMGLIVISIILLWFKNYYFFIGGLVFSFLFLYRARGLARGLVNNVVLTSIILNDK